jgi:hypothetical protein
MLILPNLLIVKKKKLTSNIGRKIRTTKGQPFSVTTRGRCIEWELLMNKRSLKTNL